MKQLPDRQYDMVIFFLVSKLLIKWVNNYRSVSQTFLHAGPFWLRKITTDPIVHAHVYIYDR